MPRVRRTTDGIAFRCPGCGDVHAIPTAGAKAWGWNGSLERPSIAPSISVASGHYASAWKPGDECWCGKGYGFSCYRCHSVIKDGRITFEADSTHELAGQTIDLPEITEAL